MFEDKRNQKVKSGSRIRHSSFEFGGIDWGIIEGWLDWRTDWIICFDDDS